MKCDNCGKNNANIRYYRNINGVEKQMNLCEECSEKLGINNSMGFNMPIDLSSFWGGFFEDFETPSLLNLMSGTNELRCKGCNSRFDDILNTGKFGCPECYETFETEIDELLNRIHGRNRHVGRLGKGEKLKVENTPESDKNNVNNKNDESNNNSNSNKIEELKNKLKELIKVENYEEAAKVRDEIKKLEN